MNEIAALLRDFGQGASNAAASNVSGPVDLLAWALRKGGVPVPSNPILGSEWMRQKGLLADPRNKIAGLLGEAAGLSAPIAAAAKAPQIARGLLAADDVATAGANRMADHFERTGAAFKGPPNQRGAIVWHGSPHKFDAFDASKIGTGEGAQAYGHGLYLAESPEVAKTYASVNGKPSSDPVDVARRFMSAYENPVGEFKRLFGSQMTDGEIKGVFLSAKAAEKNRSLYKVDLPDEKIARMLDWDKPLSQQAGMVPKVFDNAWQHSLYRKRAGRDIGDFTGADLVNAFGADSHSRALFADDLRKAGIPGIRYLDGGSRGAGTGTSNYVVFPGEESALKILERNGNPINALVQALKGPR